MIIDRTALFEILAAMPLESGRWVVAGSAPMLLAGLIDSISDVDIVADSVAWQEAVSICDRPPREGLFGDRVLELEVDQAAVEVFDGWMGIAADVIIAEAIEKGGYRFMLLERVLDSKRRLLRHKDLAHIALLEGRLSGGPSANSG